MRINIFIFLTIIIFSLGLITSCEYVNYQQGKVLFESNCAVCHMEDGSGVAKLYPSLNSFSKSNLTVTQIPCIIRNGTQNSTSVINMAGLPQLSDVEINNIVNYLWIDLNKNNNEITIEKTKELLKECE